jgi:GntR family transcriptional regulator
MNLSQRLEVSVGSPILKIKRVAFDANNRPVEFVTGFYPPDRYQYEVTLPRSGGYARNKSGT